MRRLGADDGFSLIEVLVAIGLFSVVSVVFYTALFSGVDGSATSRAVARTSEEARLGFNRMVRDTREAAELVSASATQFRIQTDFDGDNSFESPNQDGDYEDITFTFDAGAGVIRMSTPTLTPGEVLMSGVSATASRPVFSYYSNLLEYDTNGDGRTSCAELDQAPSPVVGNGSNTATCDSGELPFLSTVAFAVAVTEDGRTEEFFTQAELRNKR